MVQQNRSFAAQFPHWKSLSFPVDFLYNPASSRQVHGSHWHLTSFRPFYGSIIIIKQRPRPGVLPPGSGTYVSSAPRLCFSAIRHFIAFHPIKRTGVSSRACRKARLLLTSCRILPLQLSMFVPAPPPKQDVPQALMSCCAGCFKQPTQKDHSYPGLNDPITISAPSLLLNPSTYRYHH